MNKIKQNLTITINISIISIPVLPATDNWHVKLAIYSFFQLISHSLINPLKYFVSLNTFILINLWLVPLMFSSNHSFISLSRCIFHPFIYSCIFHSFIHSCIFTSIHWFMHFYTSIHSCIFPPTHANHSFIKKYTNLKTAQTPEDPTEEPNIVSI